MQWYAGLVVERDPNSVLDYRWELSDWVDQGDSIASHQVVADTGITVESSTNDTDSVTVWLSGGTLGAVYAVTVRVTTSAGRVDDYTVRFVTVDK